MLKQHFENGLIPENYMNRMEKLQEPFMKVYEQFTVPTNDQSFWDDVAKREWNAVVITEDWCGDAMMNVPIFFRITEAANIPTRVVYRDSTELIDHYLTNGTAKAIPIMVVFDEEGKEVAKWGPRAPEAQAFVDQQRATLPPKEAENFEEATKELYAGIQQKYVSDKELWNAVYESMKRIF
ncbi:thioredoxin family protein [Mangrovibacillus cuniculi]|uniref:Thioredoxin family protein n=1 Tax=Mangrovibacillus cuniculi TaxID=2593652 RepID=A0A7S8C903_9BACI|nr:thioredoxin family protein [Mangrovibacillus cuniculi]QPC45506.1 thioredoxin family protein [Mangrovibacillus cuniculi]